MKTELLPDSYLLSTSDKRISSPDIIRTTPNQNDSITRRMEEETIQVRSKLFICNGYHIVYGLLLCPAIFIPLDFILYYAFPQYSVAFDENGVRQIPTISLTGSTIPASIFLTYGLHLEALFLGLACLCIYLYVEDKINHGLIIPTSRHDEENPSYQRLITCIEYFSCKCCCPCTCCRCCACCLPVVEDDINQVTLYVKKWNLYNLYIGFFISFCMSVVGSVQLTLNETVHGAFAFFMFIGGILHMMHFYFRLHRYVPFLDEIQKKKILLSLFLSIPFNIFLIILDGILMFTCTDYNCTAAQVDLGPAIEFVTIGALLLYIQTFQKNVKDVEILQIVKPSLLG